MITSFTDTMRIIILIINILNTIIILPVFCRPPYLDPRIPILPTTFFTTTPHHTSVYLSEIPQGALPDQQTDQHNNSRDNARRQEYCECG